MVNYRKGGLERLFLQRVLLMLKSTYYKDRKCAVNENPSVRIELARSKTSNNGPLRNEVLFRLLDCVSVVRLSAFTRAIMHSKQYGSVLVRFTSSK